MTHFLTKGTWFLILALVQVLPCATLAQPLISGSWAPGVNYEASIKTDTHTLPTRSSDFLSHPARLPVKGNLRKGDHNETPRLKTRSEELSVRFRSKRLRFSTRDLGQHKSLPAKMQSMKKETNCPET